ncbi:EamA family transporter [uncultured Prevotella sp.]|uniref:EamA family transporter n=1 Tax=uncultured Prevotella sp. TaxID=159272 RepID=UPI0025DD6940|nr:EamA family transporter [uncultured Prevotella sp.]
MTHPPSRIAIIVAYFLIYVVWGSTYYFIGVCLRDFPPFVLGTLRFVVAGTILLVACKMRGELLFRRGLILKSAVCGIILLFVDQGVIMFAQRYVSSSLVAIMASSTAVWIMLLDVPQWRRNFRSVSTVAGIVLGFIGVAMLYLEQLNMQRPGGSHYEYGVLLLIGGCISWACGTLYSKYHIRDNGDEGGLASSAWQMLGSGLVFALCAGLSGDFSRLQLSTVSSVSWLSLSYLIVFGSMMAYTAYIWLLRVRPATEVATHAYVNPIVAVVIGAGLGHEDVTLIQLSGLAVILISVMMVNRK